MRFLRMWTNSVLAGGLGAAYLTVLVLQLNPHVPLLSGTTGRWFVTLGAFYGLHLAIACYVLIVAREFFSMDAMSPGWASIRVLAWLSATGAAIAAAMMWLNADSFRAVLGDLAARRMIAGALATGASAAVLLAIAIAHYSSRRRGSRVGAFLFALAVFASLALPLAARGAAVPITAGVSLAPPGVESAEPASPRVAMLLLDGASLEYVRTRSAEGRLPNFSKLLDAGASMYLATIRPTQPGPVWAAAATGMLPAKNGVRSAALYYARGDARPIFLLPDHCFSHALVRFGAIRAEPLSSTAWHGRPLWSILSNHGVQSGVVRWPLTYPAHPTLGFVLTDRIHELPGPMAQFDDRAASPAWALAAAGPVLTDDGGDPIAADPRDATEIAAARRDRLYSRAMRALEPRFNARVLALRLEALDPAGHHYLADAQAASAFRDGGDAERRLRAQQLERAYADVDAEIGAALGTLEPEDLLLVISGFGMQRQNLAKEVLGRVLRDPVVRGTHERAPDGFLLAYGSAVQPGRLPRGAIVDVAPTVLYFLGLPVGRDMDGFARTDLFTTAFTAERPIAFIATHNR